MLANSLRAQTPGILSRSWLKRTECSRRSIRPWTPSLLCAGRIRHLVLLPRLAANTRFLDDSEKGYPTNDASQPLERIKQDLQTDEIYTVFVHNLPYSITEEQLQDIFQHYGDVQIRMNKTLGGQSLGYSHVTFSSPNIARKAIEDSMWNPMYIEGRQIKVASARSGTVFRKLGRPMPPSRTLFVGGIPREAQYEDIQALWNDLAEIDYIRITYTEESKHRGFAHVDFKTSEDAQRIMSLHQTNPFRLAGRILRIGYAEASKEELHKVGDVSSNRTICVTRLPINVRKEELEAVFSHLGPISSTRIARYKGQGRAVAYIDFESAEFAKAVVNRCIQRQPVLEDGSVVRVAHAIRQGRVEYPPCNILFLPNYSSNEFQLRRDLGEHAKHVQRISIVGDLGNGETSRIAFIDFSNVALATEAKEAFYGNPGPLSAIGFSRPKELHQKEEAQQPVDLAPDRDYHDLRAKAYALLTARGDQ